MIFAIMLLLGIALIVLASANVKAPLNLAAFALALVALVLCVLRMTSVL